jgi:hypothetical protein
MLHIDGTDECGNYLGDAPRTPYAVFDDERQDWIVTGLPFYWLARLIKWLHS